MNAIYSITAYKIKSFKENFLFSLKRPINFTPEIKTPIVNDSNPMIFREALPELPENALTQDLLVLPKFDIQAPIWTVDSENKTKIYDRLKKGVVIYPTTSYPGGEYSIILGHSSRYPWEPGKYKAVFSLLNELIPGDRIYVFWKQKPLVYEVVAKEIFLPYPKGEWYTENIFPPNSNEKTLILQSCWPVGVDYKRIAIKTKLINW
jgi:LPXTG-site transpeptidase (sortase) family protein